MARRWAWWCLALALAVAFGADCLASDRPLVLHHGGDTFVAPNLIDYQELSDFAPAQMSSSDWALWAPVRHAPNAVRTDGELVVLQEPSGTHWLGTDDRGRDVAARLVHGTRTAVVVALGASALSLLLGLGLALVGVRAGGWGDAMVVAGCDVVTAIPALVVVVAAQGLLGVSGLSVVVVLIALPRAADTARIARGGLISALAAPYCDAARAVGAPPWRVLWMHALPQVRPALAITAALTAATAVLSEAALGFLGFGAPAPAASWGELVRQAHDNGLRWWLAVPAGVAIAVVAGAFNALAQPRE